MVQYIALDRSAARALLQQFLAQHPERLAALRERVAADLPHLALDGTPQSLAPLWEWAVPQIEPVPATGTEADLPLWFDPQRPGWNRWTPDTLWLIDGLARYLAEVILEAVPRARWRTGNALRRGYVYQHQPVLTGLPIQDVSPMASLLILARRAVDPTPGPTTMNDLFDVWTRPRR